MSESFRLPLSDGRFAIVDKDVFAWASKYTWRTNDKDYVRRSTTVTRDGKTRWMTILLHREIMSPPFGVGVDHRNGDRLDNRRDNLRISTSSQNSQNRRITPNRKAGGFKGVSWHRGCGKWQAQIRPNGTTVYLGLFVSDVEAAKAYDSAARKYFGEFAALNFPEKSV